MTDEICFSNSVLLLILKSAFKSTFSAFPSLLIIKKAYTLEESLLLLI